MKFRNLLFALLLGASAAAADTVPTPSPAERVKQELQPDGELYLIFGAQTLNRHITDIFTALERGIAESSVPERDNTQTVLTMVRMISRLAGISDIAAFGASSVRDADLGFSNRAALAAETGKTGWLWQIQGDAAPRLARIGELPADTAFAMDFGVNFRPMLDDLRKAGLGELIDQNQEWLLFKKPREILESISGDWQIALAIPAGSKWDHNAPFQSNLKKCDIFISAPDTRGVLTQTLDFLASLSASSRRIGNVVYISSDGDSAMVLVKLERRLLIFSSVRSFDKFCDGSANVGANGRFVPDAPRKAAPERKTLSGEPGFAVALKRLPADSHGAYFTSDAGVGGILKLGGNKGFRLTLPQTVSRSIGVWRVNNGMIVNQELSSEGFSTQVFDAAVGTPLLLLADRMIGTTKKTLHTGKRGRVKLRPGKRPSAVSAPQKPDAAVRAKAKCRANMQQLRRAIADYAKTHKGQLPPRLPETLKCGDGEYVYFGPYDWKPSGKMPLVADPVKGCAHPGPVTVLFVDGTIASFEFDAGSLKRLCSFLHTVHRYKEKEFIRLIELASQLDAAKGE